MLILRNFTKFILFILFLLGLAQCSWADKVYLKNGNVLEGRVIGEKADSVQFEFSLESGSGYTQIRKTEIKSIEKGPLSGARKVTGLSAPEAQIQKRSPPVQKEDLAIQNNKLKVIAGFVPVSFVILSILSLSFLSQLLKVKFDRPLGIKIFCLLVNAANIFLGLLGLTLVFLAMKGLVFHFSGFSLFIFCFLCLAIPLFFFILIFGIFNLRKWARILWALLLGMGLLAGAASLTVKKDFSADLLGSLSRDIIGKIEKEAPFVYQNIEAVLLNPKFLKEGATFNPTAVYIFTSVIFLFLLYLFRYETVLAFSKAAKFGVFSSGKMQKVPETFRLAKAEKIIKLEPPLLKGLAEFEALGYNFFLPSRMEKMHTTTPNPATAMFLEKEKNMIFSIARLDEAEYKTITESFHTHWVPYVTMLKTLSTPHYLCQTISIKEVIFEGKNGIMQIGKKNDIILYRFLLKTGENNFIECAFVNKKDEFTFGEKKVLNIIASIR